MKVVDFLKKFENLKYDDNTELLVLLTSDSYYPKFINIEYICNNEDCLGYNEIGIVLRDKGKLKPIE